MGIVKKKTIDESLQTLNDSLTLAKSNGDTRQMRSIQKCIARIESLKKKKAKLREK